MRNIVTVMFVISLATVLTGCAVGAAFSGYSLASKSADGLTPFGEQCLIDRASKQIIAEMETKQLEEKERTDNLIRETFKNIPEGEK